MIGTRKTMLGATRRWGRWILIALMIFWIYMGSSVLQSTSSVAFKFILLGGVLAITEALIGISIAMGEVFPFALGLEPVS